MLQGFRITGRVQNKKYRLAGNLYTGYQDIKDISRISEVY